jgi:hypothetical protein
VIEGSSWSSDAIFPTGRMSSGISLPIGTLCGCAVAGLALGGEVLSGR